MASQGNAGIQNLIQMFAQSKINKAAQEREQQNIVASPQYQTALINLNRLREDIARQKGVESSVADMVSSGAPIDEEKAARLQVLHEGGPMAVLKMTPLFSMAKKLKDTNPDLTFGQLVDVAANKAGIAKKVDETKAVGVAEGEVSLATAENVGKSQSTILKETYDEKKRWQDLLHSYELEKFKYSPTNTSSSTALRRSREQLWADMDKNEILVNGKVATQEEQDVAKKEVIAKGVLPDTYSINKTYKDTAGTVPDDEQYGTTIKLVSDWLDNSENWKMLPKNIQKIYGGFFGNDRQGASEALAGESQEVLDKIPEPLKSLLSTANAYQMNNRTNSPGSSFGKVYANDQSKINPNASPEKLMIKATGGYSQEDVDATIKLYQSNGMSPDAIRLKIESMMKGR
jgi:hypothetical protein